jgi:hypothetical protein
MEKVVAMTTFFFEIFFLRHPTFCLFPSYLSKNNRISTVVFLFCRKSYFIYFS